MPGEVAGASNLMPVVGVAGHGGRHLLSKHRFRRRTERHGREAAGRGPHRQC